jgi:hypothetical protein
MIPLSNPGMYFLVAAVAFLLGALGGFVAELLLRNGAGQIELPRAPRQPSPDARRFGRVRVADLGFWASVLIGSIAAVVVVFLIDPGTIAVEGGGQVDAYSVRTIIVVSIIGGSAGAAVISALQARLLAALATQSSQTLTNVTKSQFNALTVRGSTNTVEDLKAAEAVIDAASTTPTLET